jgi:CRP-like cAMP-binding protein/DNA-binding NarL/FixJ family response regulator
MASIAIVEDDDIIAADLEDSLKELGHHVVGRASSAEQAVRLVRGNKIDLFIMDIHIEGDVDGIDSVKLIHQVQDLPIIFLTSVVDKATLARASGTHAYGYLLKPFSPVELDVQINLALKRFESEKVRLEIARNQHSEGTKVIPHFPDIVKGASLTSGAMRHTIVNHLENADAFSRFEPALLAAIADVSKIKVIESDEVVISEGAERRNGFLVMSGRVAVFKTSTGGKELVVELLGVDDLYSIAMVLDEGPFSVSARAQGSTRLLVIPQEVITYLTEREPQFRRQLFFRALKYVNRAHDLARSLAHEKVEVRVASALLSIARSFASPSKDSHDVREIEMTRQELSEITGATPETISRVLNRIEDSGVVDLSHYGKVRILNQDRLASMVQERSIYYEAAV